MATSRFNRLMFTIAATVALSALGASAAPTASADAVAGGAVELDSEFPIAGQNCNPCVVTAGGESHLNLIGARVSTCRDSFTAEIYHNGTGHIAYTNANHPTGTCTRIACTGVGEPQTEREFDILNSEETSPNVAQMNVRFCLDSGNMPEEVGMHCVTPVNVSETATNHRYAFNLHARCLGGLAEVEGSYTQTGGRFEFVHL